MSNPNTDPQVQRAAAAAVAFMAATTLGLLGVFARIVRLRLPLPLTHLRLSRAAQKAAHDLDAGTPRLVDAVVDAVQDTPAPAPEPGQTVQQAEQAWESLSRRAARIIRADLDGRLNVLGIAITRASGDVYRAVASDAAIAEAEGLQPDRAQHMAYEAFLRRGITGFVDRTGRRWSLTAYVDMAVRTAVQRGFNEARIQAAQEAGINDFIVSSDGDPCPLCQPWERQVLSVGPPVPPAIASIAQATASGLFHPRCKHVLTGYVHGTQPAPPPTPWTPEDAARYAESQHQRALERAIRAAKRQVEGSLDPDMKRAANRRLRRAQKAMRDFIDKTGRVRIPRREQNHL